ncbi:MAG: hypothetical protein JSW27_02130 [Phycisphaerales bacterium]|nr:MAG: hypothetical protein JSW27_02130 [Phycisphaerales bacterium]
MNSEVSISSCGTWVHTCVDGPITRESALEFITEAARAADTQGLDRFLFDVRGASNVKRPLHDYEIAHDHLRKLGFSPVSRVALLVSPGDQTHDFFELTAANAGHVWKVFDDEDAATDWLRWRKAPGPSSEPSSHVDTD